MPSTGTRKKRNVASRRKRKGRRWRTAATSDPHILYEQAVQDPEAEVDLIFQMWKEIRGRRPTRIREDFCGTAAASTAWVKRSPRNSAVCVDLDREVLEWAGKRLRRRLRPAQRERLRLVEADVRRYPAREKFDSVLAMNFSYFIFKTRTEMKRYFRRVRAALVKDGLFLLDAYGGSDSFLEIEEERDLDGFTYIWDQRLYNPITGEVVNHIHFRFPDGTRLRDAFTYHWRLWTLPEIREMLLESGFRDVIVYWEGTDEKTGEGNGEFSPSMRGEACPGWIAYIVGVR
jgi:hypothetical protein